MTIGDGLVAQIPALILSTATAIIIITRSNMDEEKFASQSISQLIKDSKSLILVGIGMVLFGFIPGFPTGILMFMGLLMVFIGYVISMIEQNQDNAITKFFKPQAVKQKIDEDVSTLKEKKKTAAVPDENQTIENIMKLEFLS